MDALSLLTLQATTSSSFRTFRLTHCQAKGCGLMPKRWFQSTVRDLAFTSNRMLNSILEAVLSNFLDGLKIVSIKPKRIMLQTGAKNYGLHLGTLPSSAGL